MVRQLFLKVLLYNVLHEGSIGSINVLIMNFRFKFSFHHCISKRFLHEGYTSSIVLQSKKHILQWVFSAEVTKLISTLRICQFCHFNLDFEILKRVSFILFVKINI